VRGTSLKLLVAFMLTIAGRPALAQDFPPIYVGDEDETPDLRVCRITYASAVAAVQATLRQARVTVATREDYVQSRAIEAYVNINAIRVTDRVATSCAVDASLSLRSAGRVVDPTGGRTHYALLEYCDRSTLLVWNAAELQTKVNAELQAAMQQCLTEYQATIRPAR
jgi:hypothetical protein